MLNIDEIKIRLSPVFKKNRPVRRAVLFGSFARGNPTRRSDVDLIVDTGGELLDIRFYELLQDVVDALDGAKVDMFEACEIRKGSSIEQSIAEEGVVIYDEP